MFFNWHTIYHLNIHRDHGMDFIVNTDFGTVNFQKIL